MNYTIQGHEIISDEIFYFGKWVERMIPNHKRIALMINKVNKRVLLFFAQITVQSLKLI